MGRRQAEGKGGSLKRRDERGRDGREDKLEGNEERQSDHESWKTVQGAKERRKGKRRSDSDHRRAQRWLLFCLSIRGLISLWLGSRERSGAQRDNKGLWDHSAAVAHYPNIGITKALHNLNNMEGLQVGFPGLLGFINKCTLDHRPQFDEDLPQGIALWEESCCCVGALRNCLWEWQQERLS